MLKMGMVGGGPGSMIGDIHRLSAEALHKARLVCGAFSSSQEKSLAKGQELGLESSRVYSNIDELIAGELRLPDSERMDFLAITTPNYVHVDAAIKALEAGFHVMCDKPLGVNYKEALRLKEVLNHHALKFGMTYTYRGYAAIQQIAQFVKEGKIGNLRKVMVDYTQGWLTNLVENEGNKQASWRTDPKYSGAGGTIADIGTHAFNMAEYVAHQKITDLVAQVSTLVTGRQIDDDANVLIKFEKGATGAITVSQACAGEDNTLELQVYGDKGGLVWKHEEPDRVIFKFEGGQEVIDITEMEVDIKYVKANLPPGHPDSFLKGFINIYDQFIDSISTGMKMHYPGIEDGVRGMLFIEKALKSDNDQRWVELA